MERITLAAIMVEDGRIITDTCHALAIETLKEGDDWVRLPEFVEGFVTSTGRFITRKEALAFVRAHITHHDTMGATSEEVVPGNSMFPTFRNVA